MNMNLDRNIKINISHKTALVASGILGAVLFILVYGIDTLIFTNVDWIYNSSNDIVQHYIGWVYYRNSDWAFPLGVFSGLTGDLNSSIVYTDSIPLFAFIFKLFHGILPEHFQYWGLFTLLSVVLQGIFGCELVYKLTGKTLESVLSSLFFISATVMGQRMFEHTSLTCHAIILLAIILFFENAEHKKRIYIYWNLLIVLAVLIHAYYVPMVLGIELFYYIKETKLEDWYKVFARIIGSLILTIFCMYIVGYFCEAEYTSEQDWLWQFGISLNAFWNSNGHSFSAMLCGIINNEWEIEEGYAYLGMGMILLSVFSVMILVKDKKKVFGSRNVLYAILLSITFGVVSMIPTIRWNWDYVISIPLPTIVSRVLGIFRSNGRFIWPAFYMLMTFSCAFVIKKLPKKALMIISVCVLIQIIDLMPFYGQIADLIKERVNKDYTLEICQSIPDSIEHIMLMGKVNSEDIDGFDFEKTMEIGNLAAEKHIKLSDFYIARKNTEYIYDKRTETWERLLNGGTQDEVLYVFSSLPYELMINNRELNFYSADGLIYATNSLMVDLQDLNIYNGINLIAVEEYMDVRLDTYEAMVLEPSDSARIELGHCLYKELHLPEGHYSIEITSDEFAGLGIGVNGERLEYDIRSSNDDKILIDIDVYEITNVYLQLMNSSEDCIQIEKLVISY